MTNASSHSDASQPLELPPGFELLDALVAESVPGSSTEGQTLETGELRVVADLVSTAPGLSHLDASSLFRTLLERSDSGPAIVGPIPANAAHPVTLVADEAAHDAYFCIRRVPGTARRQLVRTLLQAGALFHEEMRLATGGTAQTRHLAIGAGLSAALDFMAGRRSATPNAPDVSPPTGAAADSAVRWVRGHQLFAALTQGLLLAMRSFEHAWDERDVVTAERALDLAADLLYASASAFRFTSDFPPADYDEFVRPSMAPVHVGRGFSGLLSADHRYLVDLLTRLRPVMADAKADLPRAHGRMVAALTHVYADHKFVCARFGGAEGASLRMDACSEVPGVELLKRFEKARLRLVTPRPAASR